MLFWKKIERWSYEYCYMVIMVIYMAQMTNETSRMIGGLSGNPISFFFPIVLTIILLKRNPISFKHKALFKLLSIVTIWCICIIIKEKLYSIQELSYIFFFYYAIIIAFIHCQVYGKRMFYLYEDIMKLFLPIDES